MFIYLFLILSPSLPSSRSQLPQFYTNSRTFRLRFFFCCSFYFCLPSQETQPPLVPTAILRPNVGFKCISLFRPKVSVIYNFFLRCPFHFLLACNNHLGVRIRNWRNMFRTYAPFKQRSLFPFFSFFLGERISAPVYHKISRVLANAEEALPQTSVLQRV